MGLLDKLFAAQQGVAPQQARMLGAQQSPVPGPQQSPVSGAPVPPPAPQSQPPGFLQRMGQKVQGFTDDPERMARLTMGLNSMRYKPDAGLAEASLMQIQTAQEERKAIARANRTAEVLRAAGQEEIAQAVEANPEQASAIYGEYLKKKLNPTEQHTTMTGKQVNEMLGIEVDPNSLYSVNTTTGKVSSIGGKGTVINVGGEDKFGEETAKLDAQRLQGFATQADAAGALVPDLQLLQELAAVAPSGALQGRMAENFPGFSAAGDAFLATASRMIPMFRAPGSGAMSDKDMDELKNAMGRMRNAPGANQLIYQALQAKADLDLRRGDIANRVLAGEIDRNEGRRMLSELNKQSVISPELRAMIGGTSEESGSVPEGVDAAFWRAQTPEWRAKFIEAGKQ